MLERGSRPPKDFEVLQAPLLFGDGRACRRLQLAGDQIAQPLPPSRTPSVPLSPAEPMSESCPVLCPRIRGD